MGGIHRTLQQESIHFYRIPGKTYTQEPLVTKSEVRKALQEITVNEATGVDELPKNSTR
jgi:hypothetical protein